MSKFILTTTLLFVAWSQSCSSQAAERYANRAEITVNDERNKVRFIIRIEAASFEALQAGREVIIERLTSSGKSDALKAPPSDAKSEVQGETGGFQWLSKGFRWVGQ